MMTDLAPGLRAAKPFITSRRHPPYRRHALTALRAHVGPWSGVDFRLYTGHGAWSWASRRVQALPLHPTTLLPPGENPAAYCWDLARGLQPWIVETGGTADSVLQHLALKLLQAGAVVVRASWPWAQPYRPMAVFRRRRP